MKSLNIFVALLGAAVCCSVNGAQAGKFRTALNWYGTGDMRQLTDFDKEKAAQGMALSNKYVTDLISDEATTEVVFDQMHKAVATYFEELARCVEGYAPGCFATAFINTASRTKWGFGM